MSHAKLLDHQIKLEPHSNMYTFCLKRQRQTLWDYI